MRELPEFRVFCFHCRVFVSLPPIPFPLLRSCILLILQNAQPGSFIPQTALMHCMLKVEKINLEVTRKSTHLPQTHLRHAFCRWFVQSLTGASSSGSLKNKVEHAVTLSQKGKDKNISGCLCKSAQESKAFLVIVYCLLLFVCIPARMNS